MVFSLMRIELKTGKKKGSEPNWSTSHCMAERTGLEPATPGVTGRYSNQLNYRSRNLIRLLTWWVLRDLNPRHSPCKGDALPTELNTQNV